MSGIVATRESSTRSLDTALKRLLARGRESSVLLEARLAGLQGDHEPSVYSRLLYLASNLEFTPEEACEHWRRILGHRDEMQSRLGQVCDVRVALVDYFLAVFRRFENPKVIELDLFERTMASAYRDGLTGLYNYRFFVEFIERELQRGVRQGAPLSLAMIDLDDFKRYNDTRGHEAGNAALAEVGATLRRAARGCDMPVRYGGEEFALLLPATPKTGAHVAAERVRKAVERHTFADGSDRPAAFLTVSIGLACAPEDGTTSRDLIRAADAALYEAKRAGKNRTLRFCPQ